MVSTILVIWPWYLTGVIVEKAKLESWSIEWRVYSVILVFPSHYLMEIYDFSSHGSIYQCNSYSRFSTADAISDIRLKELGTKRRLLGRGGKKKIKKRSKTPWFYRMNLLLGAHYVLLRKESGRAFSLRNITSTPPAPAPSPFSILRLSVKFLS